jgi:gluconokinase
MNAAAPLVLVLMGVSGAGKSTIGKLLAARLGWPFEEGDDLHPASNIAKMRSRLPLTDADRAPWLAGVEAWISTQLKQGRSGVIACSALKRAYRNRLVAGRSNVRLVFLKGSPALIAQRLARRRGHFMPASLLASQFATLEAPGTDESAIVADISQPPAEQVAAIIAALYPPTRKANE